MTASRAYWTGVVVLFVTLLVAGLLPMALGLPLLILALWAGAQVVKGRWGDSPPARRLRRAGLLPPTGDDPGLWNDGPPGWQR